MSVVLQPATDEQTGFTVLSLGGAGDWARFWIELIRHPTVGVVECRMKPKLGRSPEACPKPMLRKQGTRGSSGGGGDTIWLSVALQRLQARVLASAGAGGAGGSSSGSAADGKAAAAQQLHAGFAQEELEEWVNAAVAAFGESAPPLPAGFGAGGDRVDVSVVHVCAPAGSLCIWNGIHGNESPLHPGLRDDEAAPFCMQYILDAYPRSYWDSIDDGWAAIRTVNAGNLDGKPLSVRAGRNQSQILEVLRHEKLGFEPIEPTPSQKSFILATPLDGPDSEATAVAGRLRPLLAPLETHGFVVIKPHELCPGDAERAAYLRTIAGTFEEVREHFCWVIYDNAGVPRPEESRIFEPLRGLAAAERATGNKHVMNRMVRDKDGTKRHARTAQGNTLCAGDCGMGEATATATDRAVLELQSCNLVRGAWRGIYGEDCVMICERGRVKPAVGRHGARKRLALHTDVTMNRSIKMLVASALSPDAGSAVKRKAATAGCKATDGTDTAGPAKRPHLETLHET